MKNVVLFLGCLVSQMLLAQQTPVYKYSLNLEEVLEDKLEITLLTPKIENKKEIFFRFPKIVPGTYDVYNFGQYISNLKAFDKSGNQIAATRTDQNSWSISNAENLYSITYMVDDTWDAKEVDEFVFEPGGTNIEEGKNVVINTHGFFGYFEGLTDWPFEISVTRSPSFYGSTGILKMISTPHSDVFYVSNYNELVDSPIMYCEPDTTFVNVGNTKVLISVYSTGKKADSKIIAENIKTTLDAQRKYLGGTLPVEKYAFIIYLYSGMSQSGAAGALEHSNSSFYYLPEMEPRQLAKTVTDVAAHEFFHIVTPLTVHSEEIRYFDFNKPKMSKHLWLYEGVTEYFAGHMQVYEKLISPEEYLLEIQSKIKGAENYSEKISFTELSLGALDKHKDQYPNVYQKGALIGMCLDVLLRDLSNGETGVKDVMAKLSEKFGKDKAFKDDELFNIIGKVTFPEIKEFLEKHVEKNNPLPIQEMFAKAGIDYISEATVKEPSLGGAAFGFNYETNLLVVMDISNLDAMGKKLKLKNGDEIISINNIALLPENIEKEINAYKKKTKEGQKVTFVVARKYGDKTVSKKLTAKAIFVEQKIKHVLSFNDKASPKQLTTRNTWLNIK
ncbi:MAG: peptidase M61 [Bacteroidetes bacterium]|nr:peptidase M61 [Bacteroidota bacterium]MBV6461187.1 hypothetical protein [Flavobacteriales bacterium]WKZ75406.1 MAG: peptidase M61 [Vicingaceae bacterium]MCL4817261.1 peptidase M61 [Flavobacteriales bacterium]NOG96004.1 peptidase M61 [Bacteroidota bacterium]